MNEHLRLIETALESLRGDDYIRAKNHFREFTPTMMQKEYGRSGRTCYQVLEDYRLHDAAVDAALAWVRGLAAQQDMSAAGLQPSETVAAHAPVQPPPPAPAQPVSGRRLCVDCKHHTSVLVNLEWYHYCRNAAAEVVDVVTGAVQNKSCYDMRKDMAECGEFSKLWEEKV